MNQSDDGTPNGPVDFERADFGDGVAAPGSVTCSLCGAPIATHYFTRDAGFSCERCEATHRHAGPPGSAAGRFAGATVLGAVAAVAGSALWLVVTRLTGYEIGLIAIAVGWAVAVAVQVGCKGVGGRPYQLLAVFLTYTAIVMTYVPTLVEGMESEGDGSTRVEESAEFSDAFAPAPDPFAAPDRSLDPSAPETVEAGEEEAAELAPGVDKALLYLIAMGVAYAVPFLAGFENAIGILIIGFALYQTWTMTQKRQVVWGGPFQVGSASGPGATG